MEEKNYLIIADDFTGAGDTGLQLARRGIRTCVMFRYDRYGKGAACVLDTESRGLAMKEAYVRVRSLLEEVGSDWHGYVIKKVDSILRGNPAAEIRAADVVFQCDLVIFMPAVPDMGRTTVDSIHYLNGLPVTRTEAANDPLRPAAQDNIVNLLGQVYEEEVCAVTLDQIRAGCVDFSQGRVFACDAAELEDMRIVIRKAEATGRRVLYAGASAILDQLLEVTRPLKPALTLAASLSPVTAAQIAHAERAGAHVIRIGYEVLLGRNSKDMEKIVKRAVEALRMGNDVIAASAASCERAVYAETLEEGRRLGIPEAEVSICVQKTLGRIGGEILKRAETAGVMLTGGDMAISFLDEMEASGSVLVGEAAAGIPIMRVIGGKRDGLKIITKAGAFGWEDAISFGMRKLKEVL